MVLQSRLVVVKRSIAALIACAAIGGTLLAGGSAAVSQPYLRSATSRARHVVVVYTMAIGDQAPSRIAVASRPATGRGGAFLDKNVLFREPLSATNRVGLSAYRMRTRHTLRPGRYYVQVSAMVIGLDCTPKKPCPTRWSNIRRVKVPRS